MAGPAGRTRPACAAAHAQDMDVVAIVLALAFFAVLIALVEGLDRV